MLNRAAFWNTLPDGVAVLELPREEGERLFVPLRETTIAGEVAGPLAALRVTHTFGYTRADFDRPIEALYRFPLPGDAAIAAVSVRFGDVTIDAELQDREQAERAYSAAKEAGQQAALVTRESPNVFTLRLAGLAPDQPIVVATSYAQLAPPTAEGWSLRLPLTTTPRYVREDEAGSRAADGQPLAVLRDPGHRFSLDLLVRAAGAIDSPTHSLAIIKEEGGQRVALRDGAILPDRDCVIAWRPQQEAARPTLGVLTQDDRAAGLTYFLAMLAPPATPASEEVRAREAILLVDHSGSMSGAKWEAADWATRRFLGDLTPRDTFALGLFHDTTAWFEPRPEEATPETVARATDFLLTNTASGGTNLGVALEQALALPRDAGGRARHLLIVTDAEVSDADRILRLAEDEARRDNRRRISVLCIDAAPNGYLATALAERGGGVVRFLTSAPEEGDITGALDAILADWAAPLRLDVHLASDAATIEGVQGTAATLPCGDLPAGRTIWAVGRTPAAASATFRASDREGTFAEARATALPDTALLPALKALFGARRVLALEHLQGAGYEPDELCAALTRLGYDPKQALAPTSGERKLYQENARAATQGALRHLLVAEALRYGLASAETAFVAVRREAGERVAATVIVANALPAGWSPVFASGGVGSMKVLRMAALTPPSSAIRSVSEERHDFPQGGGRRGVFDKLTGAFAPASPPAAPMLAALSTPQGQREAAIFNGLPQVASGSATLFDAATADAITLPAHGRLSRLTVRLVGGTSATPLDGSLILDLFVDDLAAPRVSVSLAAITAQGGTRPLNLAWRAGRPLRLILRDPLGLCAQTGLALAVALA